MTITGCRPPLGRRMTGGRDLLRQSRGGTADTARLRRAAGRRKGSNHAPTSYSDRQSRIHFEPKTKGLFANPFRRNACSFSLQSGPKSPPTCSRVGLAWVRRASSLALLQRRQAMRGGSRFNAGQPIAYPEFIQNLRSVAQAEATGGVSPYPIPPPCLATDRLDIGYLEPVSCGYRIPPLRPFRRS